MLLGHIGIRADGLERCKLGMRGVGTAPIYEFPYLDLWFRNWFGSCVAILGFPHFYVLGWYPSFLIFGDESCAFMHVL